MRQVPAVGLLCLIAACACCRRRSAVLWLLLLSGGIAKWASLSPLGERALGGAQLALSSAVAFVLVGAVAVNGVSMLRRVRKSVNVRGRRGCCSECCSLHWTGPRMAGARSCSL